MSPRYYRLGLVGHPLDHSLSPALHSTALEAVGLAGEYRLYPLPPTAAGFTALAELLTRLRCGELHGLNVTLPHKQRLLPLLDVLTPTATAAGAVNTLFMEKGRLVGDNTDAPGFLADLHRFLTANSLNSVVRRQALVLGAGGAARAVCLALLQEGWQVWVAARRGAQARALAAALQGQPSPATAGSIAGLALDPGALRPLLPTLGLLVNATPVGMAPHPEASPWPAGMPLPPHAGVYDLVYDPPYPLLIRQAQEAGLPATSGVGMLIEQAALAFERWTGARAPREAMREAIQGDLIARLPDWEVT